MRTHIYVLAVVLCAVSARPSCAQGQSQQGSSTSQATSAKQASAASTAQQAPPASAGLKQTIDATNGNSKDPKAPTQQAGTSKQAAPPKLQIDAHKPLTNEDLQKLNKRRGMSVVGIDVDMDGIYDCDYNCYNDVRGSAGISPGGNLDWMRDLRTGIEDLQKDAIWRAELVNLAHLRSRFCTLADEQNAELRRADNSNNVTDEQINIRERYNAKLSEANEAVTAEYERITPLEATHSPLVRRFMEKQVVRIMQANCTNPDSYRRSDDTDDSNE